MAVAEFTIDYYKKKASNQLVDPFEFMNNEYLRLSTYCNWPNNAQASPSRLAKSGLFYQGRLDEVHCFSCKGLIKDWRWGTAPDVVHKTLYPMCHYVMAMQTDNIPLYQSTTENLLQQIPSSDPLSSILATLSLRSDRSIQREPIISQRDPISSHREAPPPQAEVVTDSIGSATVNTNQTSTSSEADAVALQREPTSFRSITTPTDNSTNYTAPTISSSNPLGNLANGNRARFNRNRRSGEGSDRLGNLREETRLRSYLNRWPESNPMTPEELASAGFFFTGISDRVQCAFCYGVLRNWEDNDDAMEEHRKYFPNCPFVCGEDTGNVPMEQSGNPPSRRQQNTQSLGITTNANAESVDDLGVITQRPKRPDLAVESKRLHTYQRWPTQMAQTPAELASAGFYYTGYADNVKCFFCDGGLRNWEQDDDVWESHARWFPNCGFVKNVKGDAYIKQVEKDHPRDAQVSESQTGKPAGSANGTRNIDEREIKARMDAPTVRAVLDMGYTRDLVSKAIARKLISTGDDYESAESLLEAIFEIEEQIKNGTFVEPVAQTSGAPSQQQSVTESPGVTREHTQHVQGSADTDTNKSSPQTEMKTSKSEKKKKKKNKKKNAAGEIAKPDTSSATEQSEEEPKAKDEEEKESSDLIDEIASLRAENEKQKDMRMCKICFDADASIVFLPCGHLVTCSHCAPAVRSCPICRKGIKGTVRTFVS